MTINRIEVEPMDSFAIKKASSADLPNVWHVIDTCAQWLAAQGLGHWQRYYKEDMVSKMIAKKEVYVGHKGDDPIGTVTLDIKPPKYYVDDGYNEMFTNPNDSAVYVTGLAVLPTEQNQGFAGKLLQFVEDKARDKGVEWLRLDCRTEIPGLVCFYEKRGFHTVGTLIDEGEDGTYWMMEKHI